MVSHFTIFLETIINLFLYRIISLFSFDNRRINLISEYILGEKLTIVPEFHSHLESMKSIPRNELQNQITFSYIYPDGGISGNTNEEENEENLVNLPGPFSKDVDPTR